MKRFLMMVAVAMMTAICAQAQKIEVVDTDGHGIPLVSVLTEDGNLIGTTDLNGVLADVKGAPKVAVSHVAYKPQLVTVANLPSHPLGPLGTLATSGTQEGEGQGWGPIRRITMENIDYDLDEIVVKPKPYIYVEVFYRVYVYRGDSLCYFLSGIMPNAYNIQKKKLEHGSYYQAVAEHCNKMGAGSTWFVRAGRYGAGIATSKGLSTLEQKMKEKYYVTATVDDPTHTTYSNPEGVVGQLVRTGGQMRMTIDAGKAQMYANKAKGETKILKKREEMGYEYQFTMILDDDTEGHAVENYMMDLNHWEYNDKKSHVKFFIENFATDHYYMDKQEWKDKKKSMKEDYSNKMTLEQLDAYATSHNLPTLSPATRQAIGKLKQW